MGSSPVHQYVERETADCRNEVLFGDRIVKYIYASARENPSLLFRLLTSARTSSLLSFLNYDIPLGDAMTGGRKLLRTLGVDFSECLEPPERLNTARKVFERQIRYWETRPMPEGDPMVVSPADSRMIIGSFAENSLLFLKEKFFHYEELLGADKRNWLRIFENGDFAVFRLTPEKYHYNHAPVSGRVLDIYEISGRYHSCNPGAVVELAAPYSKNKRVVTVIDTNTSGGSRVGKVAMIEVAALMIGDIVQCYSETEYEAPRRVETGMMLWKGRPKSLFRPGSSVDVLIFEKNRISFSRDLLFNQNRKDVRSRFSVDFHKPLVETEVKVRSLIATGLVRTVK